MTVAELAAAWQTRAATLDRYAPPAAAAFRTAAAELAEALRDGADELLSLGQAAAESGYSPRRLRELLADGSIPQAGRRGAPRIRRADLPRRARRTTSTAYDPADDARELMANTPGGVVLLHGRAG